MEVKTKTTYSERILKSFFKLHFRKTNLIVWLCGGIILLSGILLLALNSLVAGIIFSVLGVLFLLYPQVVLASSLNSNKRQLNAIDYYVFDEKTIQVTSEIFGEEVANQKIDYKALEKIKIDANYIYIYLNKVSAVIVERATLSEKEQKFIISKISKVIDKKKK